MKNKLSLIILLAVPAIVFLSSCRKDLPDAGVYFCSKVDLTSNEYTLIIDEKEKGILTYFSDTPDCSDKSKLMLVMVKSGKHDLKITDKDNKTVLEGTLKATAKETTFSGGDGVYTHLSSGECSILQFTN